MCRILERLQSSVSSPVTIKKVLASTHAAGSNKITTHELAERMGSTVRNANRIIQNLENGGVAKLAYTQTTNAKGRPVKVYELYLISKEIY